MTFCKEIRYGLIYFTTGLATLNFQENPPGGIIWGYVDNQCFESIFINIMHEYMMFYYWNHCSCSLSRQVHKMSCLAWITFCLQIVYIRFMSTHKSVINVPNLNSSLFEFIAHRTWVIVYLMMISKNLIDASEEYVNKESKTRASNMMNLAAVKICGRKSQKVNRFILGLNITFMMICIMYIRRQ